MKNLEEIRNEIVGLKDLMASYDLKFNLIESDIDCRFVIETERPHKFFNAYIVAYRYDKESTYVRCFIVTNQLNGLETKPRTIYASCWDSAKIQEPLQNNIFAFCAHYSSLHSYFTDIQNKMREIDRICDDKNLPKIIFNFD